MNPTAKQGGSASITGQNNPFSEWIKSVLLGVPKDEGEEVVVSVNVAMNSTSWLHLAHGASRTGWTLEEAIKRLLVDGGPGLSEWSNQGFAVAGERKEGGAL